MDKQTPRSLAAAILTVGALTVSTTQAFGQDVSVLAGTYEVAFLPVQSAGKKLGCSLVYKAIALDRVYEQGKPTLLNGGRGPVLRVNARPAVSAGGRR